MVAWIVSALSSHSVDANVAIRIFGGLDNTLADTSLTPSLESELEMLHSNTSFLH